jgi:hypothetical protein
MNTSFWNTYRRAFVSFFKSFGNAFRKALGLFLIIDGTLWLSLSGRSEIYSGSSSHIEIFVGGLILFWKS